MRQIAISTLNERMTKDIEYLTDAEALSVITGISLDVLSKMITAYNFHGLIRQIDLLEITQDQRTRLELVYNISQRIGKAQYKNGVYIKRPEDIGQLFVSELQFESVEVVAVAFLDVRNRLIKLERMFTGSTSSTVLYPRDVIRRALLYNASSIVLSHNHPSGVSQPSMEDIEMTKRLDQALSIIDLKLMDHILVANNSFISFKQEGIF